MPRLKLLLLALVIFRLGQADTTAVPDPTPSYDSGQPRHAADTTAPGSSAHRIKIRNHIAYHFKKVVREITQELLISRKMDVNPMIIASQALAETATTVLRYCDELSIKPPTPVYMEPPTEKPRSVIRRRTDFALITWLPTMDRVAAMAICEARGMQLPELYDKEASDALNDFLVRRGIKYCFAGLVPDPIFNIWRFKMSGLPVWEGYRAPITIGGYHINPERLALDEMGSAMIYTNDSKLELAHSTANAASNRSMGDPRYWNDPGKPLVFITAPVICQGKWDGSYMLPDNGTAPEGMNVKKIPATGDVKPLSLQSVWKLKQAKRHANLLDPESVDYETTENPVSDHYTDEVYKTVNKRQIMQTSEKPDNDLDVSKSVCRSIALSANETYNVVWAALHELLGQIDISMRSTGNTDQNRKKRFVGLLAKKGLSTGLKFAFKQLTPGRFKFSTGTKIAWSLFGLAQNSHTTYVAHKAKKLVREMRRK